MLETVGAGLRPLTTTAIVDEAVEHVRADPVLWYGIVAPVSLPFAAIGLWFFDLANDYRGAPDGYGVRVTAAAAALTLLFHLRFVAEGALAWALEQRLRGVTVTAAGAWSAALGRSLTLVFTGSLFWALASVTALFALIPAVVPFGLLCLAPAIVMVEQTAPFKTLRRSLELGWLEIGRSVGVFCILLLGALVLALGAALALRAVLDLGRTIFYTDLAYLEAVLSFTNPTFSVGALLFGLALLEPVKGLSFALLYVDRRVRTEGFDLKRKVQLILEREKAEAPAEVGP